MVSRSPRVGRTAGRAVTVLTAAMLLAVRPAGFAAEDGATPGGPTVDGGLSTEPTSIQAVYVLDELPLPLPSGQAEGAGRGFRLGGISDLQFAGSEAGGSGPDASLRFWAVTDRGPNGVVSRPMVLGQPPVELRTLAVPAFAPLIVELVAEPAAPGRSEGRLRVGRTIPITTPAGGPISGRPTPTPNVKKPMVEASTLQPLAADPYGFDTEGVVRLRNGDFWIAEEYVPSLARIAPDGRVLGRLVPRGTRIDGCDAPLQDVLPADYARRRDNRGFEALAVSPDESFLFAMLQSPLESAPPAADPPGAVRLIAVDPAAKAPRGEYLYRLGSPDDRPDGPVAGDGKVSALAALGPGALLVLEQSDHHSRLYRVDLPAADAARAADPPAGRAPEDGSQRPMPIAKRLVADLLPLVNAFNCDIEPEQPCPPAKPADLKFEGLAVLDDGRIALVNDNDFDIRPDGTGAANPPRRRTCLWLLRCPDNVRPTPRTSP